MDFKQGIMSKAQIKKYTIFAGLVIVTLAGVSSGYLLTSNQLNSRNVDTIIAEELIDSEPLQQKQEDTPDETEVTEPEVKDTIVVAPPVQKVENKPAPPPADTAHTYSLGEAASLTVVVNKKNKLPSNYTPSLSSVAGGSMRPDVTAAMSNLLTDASNAGVPMKILSSYRSYNTQINTYNKWVRLQGKAQADRSSARPGHSEHQSGLTADLGTIDSVCNLEICFGNTAQGKWLAAHAQEYGFIIRYKAGTESITGYQYEPWHIRYLGIENATAVVNSGLTLDQYYGVAGGGY